MTRVLQIESRENPKIKEAIKIRQGKIKNQIFIEGFRLAEEVLRSEVKVTRCFLCKRFDGNRKFSSLIENFLERDIEIVEVNEKIFSLLADTKTSQGLILTAETPSNGKINVEKSLKTKNRKLLIYLNEINNPANLGAILRTAEAAGVTGVITSKNSAYIFSPKTMRSAMGANLRLPVWIDAEYRDVLELAIRFGLRTTVADIKSAENYQEIDWKVPRLLIFGSEAHGLPTEKMNSGAENIFIPMADEVESLNLAVACGIILFEWKNYR